MDALAVVGFIGFLVGCLFGVWSGIRIMKHLAGPPKPDRLYLDREIRRVAALETAKTVKP